MQQLAEVLVELRVLLHVAQRVGVLVAAPVGHRLGRGQLRGIDVNHRGVRPAQRIHVLQRLGVNLLGQRQPVATGLGEADQFLQPRRAGGLHVYARAGAAKGVADDRVDGKLVAAAVHTELQVIRQAVLGNRMGDHSEVVVEFLLELLQVAHVIHALVETPGELRRDGLQRHAFICQRRENDQKLRRRLRHVGFVHGHLGNEVTLARFDVPVNRAGLGHRAQVFAGDGLDVLTRDLQRRVDALDAHAADQLRMFPHEHRNRVALGRLPDKIRHVDGEEIRAVEILVDRVHVDVVGIHVPTLLPAQCLHRRLGGVINALRFRADEAVLAVGLVPDRHHFDAIRGQLHTRLQLRLSLVRKSVAHAHGVFF